MMTTKQAFISTLIGILFVSCKSTTFRQDLIYRELLFRVTELNPHILDNAVKKDRIKAIHYGVPNDTIIKNHLVFTEAGYLKANYLRTGRLRTKLYYDRKNRLKAIKMKGRHRRFDADSLAISYNKNKPVQMSKYNAGRLDGKIDLLFTNEICQMVEYFGYQKKREVQKFDYYYFDQNHLMYEVHREFEMAETTTYRFNGDTLLFDETYRDNMRYITYYDSLKRQVKDEVKKRNSYDVLSWREFLYEGQKMFPHTIIYHNQNGEEVRHFMIEYY